VSSDAVAVSCTWGCLYPHYHLENASATSVAMALISVRELIAFPTGDNATDTIVSGAHFNLTTLKYWNYTYYSNHTFSNGSKCFLTFDPYTPTLLANGTFLNSTSCYSPIKGLRTRGIIGLSFGVYFGLSIMFTLINLRKHGRLFLPAQKRFRPIGRRWQWYWMIIVGALAMISGIGSIDVDRYYLPEFPLVLSNLAWFMMLPSIMCSVWESVRHWGSWQERQVIDPNPFSLSQDDKRARTEFYMPLVFYLFCFLVGLPAQSFCSMVLMSPELFHDHSAVMDRNRKATIPRPDAVDCRTDIDRHSLQSRCIFALPIMAGRVLLPTPFYTPL
jgi:hypothetical protein